MNTSDIVEAERAPLRTKNHPYRVLIADDHALFRDGLRRLLEEAGLTVVGQAGDGKEAAALAQRLKPDLLVLDLSMPKHSGMEASEELKQDKKSSVRVMLLTAAIETSEIVKALQLGACGIVMKAPVTEVLLTAIQTVMAGGCWVGLNRDPDLFQYRKSQTRSGQDRGANKNVWVNPPGDGGHFRRGRRHEQQRNCPIFQNRGTPIKASPHHIFNKLGMSKRLELALFAVTHSLPLVSIE